MRTLIGGLPYSTEGYERAKTILKFNYGKKSEIVNAYVQNIVALPKITGTCPAGIHEFYDKLVFNVQPWSRKGNCERWMAIDKESEAIWSRQMTLGTSGIFPSYWICCGNGRREALSPNNRGMRSHGTKKNHPIHAIDRLIGNSKTCIGVWAQFSLWKSSYFFYYFVRNIRWVMNNFLNCTWNLVKPSQSYTFIQMCVMFCFE